MAEQVRESLSRFFNDSRFPIVVFLGAGVSARAGLPVWRKYVEQLAEGIRACDSLTTQQMHQAVAEGNYALAVEYFRLSHKMVDGEKWQLMSRLLSEFDAARIKSVAALPARAFLTTNFDRSIFDATAAIGKAPRDYKLGDTSFKQAQWEENFFVARIHGAVEVPGGMVLSESQFQRLLTDEDYWDLLRTCFTQKNVLFLGFSFYDPAIRAVFDEINRRSGPGSPGRHMALLPSDATTDFVQKASRLNIEVVKYDPDDDHAQLWDGIAAYTAPAPRAKPTAAAAPRPVEPFEFTKRYLAASYARARSQGSARALREAIAEGIVSAVLQEAAPGAIARAEVLERIRLALGMRGPETETLVDAAVKALHDAGLCRRLKDAGGRESLVCWTGPPDQENGLKSAIAALTRSCVNRLYLQEGLRADRKMEEVLTAFFNKLVTRRGWDLGAAFAAGRAPENVSISSLIAECAAGLPAYDRERLTRVCEAMVQKPSEQEGEILRELGRVSFALELAFQKPRSVLVEHAILPRSLFFDASVLMPAIVEGHPYSPVYARSIKRLRETAAAGAMELKTCVLTAYLNEIITHRAIAEEYANELGREFPEYVRVDALYHGVANVNVFVGAYANTYDERKESFEQFLRRVAPYRTETELKRWLEGQGFNIVDARRGSSYAPLYQTLERAYAARLARGKRPILIEHDSLQLSLLDEELKRGENSLFVTADRALHTALSEGPFANLTGMMLSHVALVQFIDLLLGGLTEDAGVTELLWSARISDQANAVRSFFTTRGLQQYDDAMTMEMPRMVEKFSDQATRQFERQGLVLDTDDPKRRAQAIRSLGALEKDYLENMRQAADKLRARLGDV